MMQQRMPDRRYSDTERAAILAGTEEAGLTQVAAAKKRRQLRSDVQSCALLPEIAREATARALESMAYDAVP
jgi:hypothetical protein